MGLPCAKKSYSQNWLVDETVPAKIIAAADLKPADRVLEIGPGTGVLTQALVDAGARVTAIEADPSLIKPLHDRFGNKIDLVQGDVLTARIPLLLKEGLGVVSAHESYKLIANLPYHVTSDILRRFLTTSPKPSTLVLMLQKEVVDRITAAPPNMSLLSVVCQLYAQCEKIAAVPRGAFRPIPKVDSAIVRLDPVEGDDHEREAIIRVAKAGFSSPRKQLHGNLSRALHIPSDRVKQGLVELHLNPKVRAEALSIAQWKALTHKLEGPDIHGNPLPPPLTPPQAGGGFEIVL